MHFESKISESILDVFLDGISVLFNSQVEQILNVQINEFLAQLSITRHNVANGQGTVFLQLFEKNSSQPIVFCDRQIFT